jgi:hypothetical protein
MHHNDTQHKGLISETQITLSITLYHYTEYWYDECHVLFTFMLNAVMLKAILLNVILLSYKRVSLSH